MRVRAAMAGVLAVLLLALPCAASACALTCGLRSRAAVCHGAAHQAMDNMDGGAAGSAGGQMGSPVVGVSCVEASACGCGATVAMQVVGVDRARADASYAGCSRAAIEVRVSGSGAADDVQRQPYGYSGAPLPGSVRGGSRQLVLRT